jgi:DNA-binding transcriptional LysR family regulator
MQLNLRQIEVFRALMVAGSISGAAKLLYISQPGVSRMIAHIESRLGLVLFERIKGRLYPTPEARRLFVEVDAVYQGVQRVNEIANDLVERTTGTLRLVVSPSLGQTLIPMALAKFHQRFPNVKVNVATQVSTQLIQTLLMQQADVGVAMFPLDHPNLQARAIYEDHLVAMLPAHHPLASRKELHIRDLVDLELIGYARDTPFGHLIEKMFNAEDLALRLAIEVRLTHTACAMVQAGIGVAVADEIAVLGRVWPDVVVRPLLPDAFIEVNVIQARYQPLSRVAQDFIETLTNLQYHTLRRIG